MSKKEFHYCFNCDTKTVYYIRQFNRYHCLSCKDFVEPTLKQIKSYFRKLRRSI